MNIINMAQLCANLSLGSLDERGGVGCKERGG